MSSEDPMQSEISPEKLTLNLQNRKEAVEELIKNENDLFKLEKLNISYCDLSSIPPVVFNIKYLTELNLSNNFLESLPEEIGNLPNLLILNLCENRLSSLPKSLKNAYQLTFLNVSNNILVEVPDVLYYGLRNLKILNLSFNDISQFCDAPECMSNLIELRLSNNSLEMLPTWLFDSLCQLQILDISENNFTCQPVVNYYSTGIFDSLRVLNMENSNCRLENTQFLSYFKNLEALHLGNKSSLKIKNISNYFGNFKIDIFRNFHNIRYLYLQNVQISTLPRDFDCFKNIELLNLSDNFLSWLPESFCNLTSLKILYLTSNQLLFLPSDIGKLINLQQIHLGNNKLYELPVSFYNLYNLEFIDLYNNKIEKINPNIFVQQKLRGIDLGLNCIDFGLYECTTDAADTVQVQYEFLKKVFRHEFRFLDCRLDLQTTKPSDETNRSSSHSEGRSFCEDENDSDCEDLSVPVSQDDIEDEDWEKKPCEVEKDEMFDPHDENCSKLRTDNAWGSYFQSNFCPANGHARSIMKSYIRNIRLASNNESVEEGQFDSD